MINVGAERSDASEDLGRVMDLVVLRLCRYAYVEMCHCMLTRSVGYEIQSSLYTIIDPFVQTYCSTV